MGMRGDRDRGYDMNGMEVVGPCACATVFILNVSFLFLLVA
jgi:hypothetical protein